MIVIIPQADIDKVERARVELFKLFEANNIPLSPQIFSITQPMWRLTHVKYKTIEGNTP